jgi:hypothetical protein
VAEELRKEAEAHTRAAAAANELADAYDRWADGEEASRYLEDLSTAQEEADDHARLAELARESA